MERPLQLMFKSVARISIIKRYKSQLNQAVKEAEGIVGYSTSFLNLRWLLTDEVANIAFHLRRLIGTNHPLLKTARKLFFDSNISNWGLIVLLISKTTGLNYIENDINRDRVAGILNSQRVIAEVTEMIRTSNAIHKCLTNVHNSEYSEELMFGNKIALLAGDFLLSRCYNELAQILNRDVSYVMSTTLRDLAESEFISSKPYRPISTEQVNIQNILSFDELNCKMFFGNPRAEWIYRNLLGGASLLGKACQCTLKLAKHPESIQRIGYIFGANVALAWKIQLEQESFKSNTHDLSLNLVSAPVMLHLEQDTSFFDLIQSHQVDYNELRNHILLGNSLNATKLLQHELCSNALEALIELPNCDARTALENIVKTIK